MGSLCDGKLEEALKSHGQSNKNHEESVVVVVVFKVKEEVETIEEKKEVVVAAEENKGGGAEDLFATENLSQGQIPLMGWGDNWSYMEEQMMWGLMWYPRLDDQLLAYAAATGTNNNEEDHQDVAWEYDQLWHFSDMMY